MDEKIAAHISDLLKKDKHIVLAYIFGSFAKRDGGRHGDVDVAVMLEKEPRGLEKLKFVNTLSSKIEQELKLPVDIVILNHASVALQQQIVKHGRLLFERRRGLAHKFIVDTITAYLDYLNILNFFYKRTVRKGT